MNSPLINNEPPQDLESLLRAHAPKTLPPALLARIERCIEDTLSPTMVADLDEHETTSLACQQLQPRALTPELLEKCAGILSARAYPLSEKVLLFPKARVASHASAHQTDKDGKKMLANKTMPWTRWGSVAAVATIAALLAWRSPLPNADAMTGSATRAAVAAHAVTSPSPSTPHQTAGVVTTSYGSGVKHASDEGVMWTPDHQAQRVIRVQYQDKVLVRDAQGIERMLLVPREEYLVVPEKVD